MDKNAIKSYAIWARRELIEKVTQRALLFGVAEGDDYDINADIVNGNVLTPTEKEQRRALIEKIREHGYEQTMEEAAYTWFNRFAALRFMEVNGYLPTHIRVFTNDEGDFKPQIMTEAIHLELEGLDKSKVFELKDANKDEELFKYLIIAQCNALNSILPGMFQKIADYTELLFPDNLLRDSSVIGKLISDIPEENFDVNSEGGQVEIIGWLYQYYISEKHEEVIDPLHGKVVKKEEIPAATQLFTTDWVVRYLIDNSVGRYWIERNPNSKLADSLTYFVKPKSGEIEFINEAVKPQDVTVFDPCVGSGHFLIYAFEVLTKIYVEYGYSERDAASEIVKCNLFGLDIDGRASQLAYFSVMMKARQYDRRFFSRGIQPNVYEIVESNNANINAIQYFCGNDKKLTEDVNNLLSVMKDAKEYGSILLVPGINYPKLESRFESLKNEISVYNQYLFGHFRTIINTFKLLNARYAVVATNPPYLSKYDATLKKYIKDNYKDYSGDLFSVFIYRNFGFCNQGGYSCFMSPFVWMFIKTYEPLRSFIINNKHISTLIQMEYSAFEEATVPICSFVLQNKKTNSNGCYIRLTEFRGGMEVQRKMVIEAINKKTDYFYESNQLDCSKIPGSPIAYWVSEALLGAYNRGRSLSPVCKPTQGLATGDNDRFVRLWWEVSSSNTMHSCHSHDECMESKKKWFPYNKGGQYRKWYGNNDYVINWKYDGRDIKEFSGSVIRNPNTYFCECISWSKISSGPIAFRYKPIGHIYDVAGTSIFTSEKWRLLYTEAFCNSIVALSILKAISPTLNYEVGQIATLPIIEDKESEETIVQIVEENTMISKCDWDDDETSWDFKKHPLLPSK